MSFEAFVVGVNYFILAYFVGTNAVYLALYVISFAEVADYVRREVFSGLSELFASNYAPPVSVVVPAYNEEATIAESVRSFLTLRYPMHEVVVVNDGSKDRTLEVLLMEFDLHESDRPVRVELETAPIRGVYASETERLVVVDKENGEKADALNVGACAARYPLVCNLDADIILEEDTLLRAARPMIESREVAAVGGIVRVIKIMTGSSSEIVLVPYSKAYQDPGFEDMERRKPDTRRVTSLLGWSPENTLEDILERVISYVREQRANATVARS